MKGGFPLSAPLALLAMTFILGVFAAVPVATLTSVGCSIIVDSDWRIGGSAAAAGGILTGILVPLRSSSLNLW